MELFRHHYRWLPLVAYLACFFVLIPCATGAPLASEPSPGGSPADLRAEAARGGPFPLLVGGGVQYPHEEEGSMIWPFFLFLVIVGAAAAVCSQFSNSHNDSSSSNK